MCNHRKEFPIWDDPKILDNFPFLDNRAKIRGEVIKSFQDIPSRLKLPCHNKPHGRRQPYERLTQKRNGEIVWLQACDKHNHVISTTIVINTAGYVKVERLEPCVESMVGDTFGAVHNFLPQEPDAP